MPGSTGAPWDLPHPVGTEQPFVHLDMKALAEAVAGQLGEAWPCTSATRPPHKPGRHIFETDTEAHGISDGVEWHMFDTLWRSYPFALLTEGNPFAIGSGKQKAVYRRQGRTITAQFSVTIGATTTQGTGFYRFPLPYTVKADSATQPAFNGPGQIYRASGNARKLATVETVPNMAFAYMLFEGGGGGVLGATQPYVSWGDLDGFGGQVTYEANVATSTRV